MRQQNAYLYLKVFTISTLITLVDGMQQIGFSLLNPATQTITAIRDEQDVEHDDDLIGDHMAVTEEWLATRLLNRSRTSLLWWREDWTSVFFRVDFHDQGVELLIELNNVLGETYGKAVLDQILYEFKQAVIRRNALGLVIDPEAITEAYEWSSFFFFNGRLAGELPALLAIPVTKLGQVVANTTQIHKETLQEFVIFSRTSKYNVHYAT